MIRDPTMQFSIKYLMALVAVAAFLLTLLVRILDSGSAILVMAIPCLILLIAWWLWFVRYRRVCAIGFGFISILINMLYVIAMTYPAYMLMPALIDGWIFVSLPSVGGLGTAWALLATHERAIPRRSPPISWALVVLSALMPPVTLATSWPLRLAFVVARPGLERLADRVETGQGIVTPIWIGPFRLAASAVDPTAYSVGLFIDPNPGGRTGFVRVHAEDPEAHRFGLLLGTDTYVELGWGWTYRQDD